MALWSSLRVRLRSVLRRNAVADEIREELEFHVRMRAEEYERAGSSPAAARRRALVRTAISPRSKIAAMTNEEEA